MCVGATERKGGVLPDLLNTKVGLAPQPLVRVANKEVLHKLYGRERERGRVCVCK